VQNIFRNDILLTHRKKQEVLRTYIFLTYSDVFLSFSKNRIIYTYMVKSY